VQKPTIKNRKCLPRCELINPYNFFHCQCVSPYATENVSVRRWSFRDSRVSGSFKVSASVSEAAMSRLGIVSDFKRLVSILSRTKFWTSRSRLGLGDMDLGSCLGLGSEGLVHISGSYYVNAVMLVLFIPLCYSMGYIISKLPYCCSLTFVISRAESKYVIACNTGWQSNCLNNNVTVR